MKRFCFLITFLAESSDALTATVASSAQIYDESDGVDDASLEQSPSDLNPARLNMAVLDNNHESVKQILSRANPVTSGPWHRMMLIAAASLGSVESAQVILKAGV